MVMGKLSVEVFLAMVVDSVVDIAKHTLGVSSM